MRQAKAVLALKSVSIKIAALIIFFILRQFHVKLGRRAFICAALAGAPLKFPA